MTDGLEVESTIESIEEETEAEEEDDDVMVDGHADIEIGVNDDDLYDDEDDEDDDWRSDASFGLPPVR